MYVFLSLDSIVSLGFLIPTFKLLASCSLMTNIDMSMWTAKAEQLKANATRMVSLHRANLMALTEKKYCPTAL